MESAQIGTIYSTTDYDAFKRLAGNRGVTYKRQKKIANSIKKNGYTLDPIKVNENMEIIDGQGRFQALKDLGLPIQYYVSPGAGINDCISMNASSTNWSTRDYIESAADRGDESCRRFIDMMDRYGFDINTAVYVLSNSRNASSKIVNSINNGTFTLRGIEDLDDMAAFVSTALGVIGNKYGRTHVWALALNFIYNCPKVDNQKFLHQLRNNTALISPIVNTRGAVEVLERIYNYHARGNVYLISEYDHYKATGSFAS